MHYKKCFLHAVAPNMLVDIVGRVVTLDVWQSVEKALVKYTLGMDDGTHILPCIYFTSLEKHQQQQQQDGMALGACLRILGKCSIYKQQVTQIFVHECVPIASVMDECLAWMHCITTTSSTVTTTTTIQPLDMEQQHAITLYEHMLQLPKTTFSLQDLPNHLHLSNDSLQACVDRVLIPQGYMKQVATKQYALVSVEHDIAPFLYNLLHTSQTTLSLQAWLTMAKQVWPIKESRYLHAIAYLKQTSATIYEYAPDHFKCTS